MLETSMKLCSMYSYYRRNMCVTKINNLSEKLYKLEMSTIAPLKILVINLVVLNFENTLH